MAMHSPTDTVTRIALVVLAAEATKGTHNEATMTRAPAPHTSAWVAQVWITWFISFGATLGGVWLMPADVWVKGYLFMGVLFTVGSTMTMAKTVRDNHEAGKLSSVINDARLEKILAEHDPLK